MPKNIPRISKPNKFEIRNSAISISISFDPAKMIPLLMGVAACDEMHQQLKRRDTGHIVRLFEDVFNGGISEHNYHLDFEYKIRLQQGDVPLEYVPLREWPQLARRLRLYVGKDDATLKRESKRAIKYVRERAHDKLVRALRQFLFEALHAATGRPIIEEKQRELEEIGTMVNKVDELRAAGRYKPADLRAWEPSKIEKIISFNMKEVSRIQAVTYDSIAVSMQREYEFVPILTGENLRKLISYHRLNWKELKKRKS